MKNREQFSGNLTIIMAMAGSAIGLGNIWRFPYIVGEYGGAAFIIIYFLACLIFALPIFFAESVIGRRGGMDTFGSMKKLAPGSKWYKVGMLTIISPIIILSYYSVVGGWSIHYLLESFGGALGQETGHFGEFISSVEAPILAHTVFIALVAAIVLAGVKKGIEKFSKYTMPVLFILILVTVIYSLTLPGAGRGVSYLVKPDFSKLTAQAFTAAVGQAFFSLSLGVGTVLTYASYMRKKDNMLLSGVGTASFDLIFALLAGYAVMPAVFAAGLSPASGPGVVFETLPGDDFDHRGDHVVRQGILVMRSRLEQQGNLSQRSDDFPRRGVRFYSFQVPDRLRLQVIGEACCHGHQVDDPDLLFREMRRFGKPRAEE